jgi:hypothetical protein
MNIPNRISIFHLRDLPPGKISTFTVDELAALASDLAEAKTHLAAIEAKFRNALDLKYGSQAQTARQAAGKDTGVARVTDGRFVIVAELPKKVKWDQAKVATAIKTITDQWRDDPAQYVTTEFKVSEAAYAAWPLVVRKLFEPARTVEHGKPTYRIELQDGEVV